MPARTPTSLAERVRGDLDRIAVGAVSLYRGEIVDYAADSGELIESEVLEVTRRVLTHILDNIESPDPEPRQQQIAEMRRALLRRAHQGIALTSIQHAFRIFGEYLFGLLPDYYSTPDDVAERDEVIRAGLVIMRYVDEVIHAVTQAYLDELEDVSGDRDIVSRHLLDAILSGRASSPSTMRDARLVGITLQTQNVLLVARPPLDAEGEHRPRTLRQAAKLLREALLSPAGPALVGVREGSVICLCPAPDVDAAQRVVAAAHEAARALDDIGMCIGVAGWRRRPEDLPAAYREAREAVDLAIRTGVHDRAVLFDDAMIDRVLRSNETAQQIVSSALDPLREYDDQRGGELLNTIRLYIRTNFSIAATARELDVHGNTVVYRLDRIRRLTGRDPRSPDDVVFLALALRFDGAAVD